MSIDRANLPASGEQVTFEDGDCVNHPERVTVRVGAVLPGGMGMVTITGWRIGAHGFPAGEVELSVPVTTVEARRLHR